MAYGFNENHIFLIIKNLNSDKVHGWDNISIGGIQLCGKEIDLPHRLLSKSVLDEDIFLEDWKKK